MDRNRSPEALEPSDDLDALQAWFFESFGDIDLSNVTADDTGTTPSEDIWKKFELLPTPPISPQHETSYPDPTLSTDRLQLVSDSLDDLEFQDFSLFDDTDLNSNLIQDPMWSSFVMQDGKSSPNVKKDISSQNNKFSDMKSIGLSGSISDMRTSECVDPMAIFPISPTHETRADSLGNETPSDSEDEEIDVVTVSQSQMPSNVRRKIVMPASASMSAQVAAMHNYTAPAPPLSPSSSSSSSGYSSSSSPSPPPSTLSASHHNYYSTGLRVKKSYAPYASGTVKKLRITLPHPHSNLRAPHSSLHSVSRNHHRHHHRHKRPRPGHSSRSSSDSEDSEDKRSQHNILERKRRDDLKLSFSMLRASVPELNSQERAPKVVILRKAADFIHSVTDRHCHLESELERQRRRNEQLKQRLTMLRNM